MISKKILIIAPVSAIFLSGVLLFGTKNVYAQNGNNPMNGLAQAIASKFNLTQSDVQAEITAYMQTERQNFAQNSDQRLKTRLDQEVAAGKITGDQETAIINELNSLNSKYLGDIKSWQNDLKAWESANNLSPALIPFGFGGIGMHRGWMGRGPKLTPIPTP